VSIRLVIPVHDEGARLVSFLSELAALARGASAPPTEVIVVDDGSGPASARLHAGAVAAAARRFADERSPHSITLVTAPENQGKGAAIRLGWGAGGAAWLGFVDGDGAVPAAEVWRLATMLSAAPHLDALLGVRKRRAGRRVQRTPLRDLQGRVFARLVEAVLGLGLHDPQCGLKFFRAERIVALLPALEERHWLLDLEVLLTLARAGGRFLEEPIDWCETGHSKLIAVVDPLRMAMGLLRIRARQADRRPGAIG